jgi:transcriptional regulator with XRE-family HTH domain
MRGAVRSIGDELRNARLVAGLSQREAGLRSGMSHTQVGRIEHGELQRVNLEHMFRLAVVVGLSPTIRFFPGDDAVRDAGHLRLLERFRSRLHPLLRWRTEVPVMDGVDGRAWDAVVAGPGVDVAVEAETRLHDVQALERRLNLKIRDGRFRVVALVVADTVGNRRALAAAGGSIGTAFPVPQREFMAALGAGRTPRGGAIVVL